MTTTRLPSLRPDALVYQQTMDLSGAKSSVFFSFENVARDGGVRNRVSHPESDDPGQSLAAADVSDHRGKQADRLQDG